MASRRHCPGPPCTRSTRHPSGCMKGRASSGALDAEGRVGTRAGCMGDTGWTDGWMDGVRSQYGSHYGRHYGRHSGNGDGAENIRCSEHMPGVVESLSGTWEGLKARDSRVGNAACWKTGSFWAPCNGMLAPDHPEGIFGGRWTVIAPGSDGR